MNNYYYIVASLPVLSLKKEESNFNYEKIREQIYSLCSQKDRDIIDFFESGLVGENLNSDFYQKAFKSPNKFTRLYYSLDLAIRNKKVNVLASQIFGQDKGDEIINKYTIPLQSLFTLEQDDNDTLNNIFQSTDILGKEKNLDDFRWEKYNLFTSFQYFTLDNIISFLAKANMIERWNKLDKEKGKELFKRLVDEVRGTFETNKLSNKIDEDNG